MINEKPRVRFAPSPTGYLHVGGLRTALYNYLFAKHNGGKFILRIEDTDRNRYVEGAVENLLDTMKWTGLEYDEGPDNPGEYGPYTQSERLDKYKQYAGKLIDEKKAYRCFCTPERLTALREEQQKQKLPQAKYDKHCLSLTSEAIETKINNSEPYVVRMNIEPGAKVAFKDIVRGNVEFDRETIDDQVLIKSDGFPTYHLANVVDDHLMKITHVIRGEEWLSSTPKHVLLYEFLGWELPEFAHLPLLLNPDKSKLSKRQGDVAVEDYKKKGYFKEALNNFVALLGWSTSDNQEYFELDELVEKFSLDRVHKAGAVFNIDKLNWLNTEHLKKKSADVLLNMLKIELADSKYKDIDISDDYLLAVIEAMRERVGFVHEYIDTCEYFYEDVKEYDEKVKTKCWKDETPGYLNKFIETIAVIENPKHDEFMNALGETAKALEVGKGKLMLPLRLALSGVGGGPGMFDLMEILGKEKVIARINTAIEKLS